MVKKLKPDAPDPPGQFHQQQQEQIRRQQQQQQQENIPDDWVRGNEIYSLIFSGPQYTAQDSRPSSTLQNTPQQTSQAIQSQPLSHQANQLPALGGQTTSIFPVPTPPQNSSTPSTGANAQHAQLQYGSAEVPQQQQYSGLNQPSFRLQYSGQPQTNGGAINSLMQPVSGNSPSLVQPVSRPGGSQALFIPHNIGGKRPSDYSEQYGAPLKCTATSPLFPQDSPGPEAPRGPLVAQFPQRNRFEGNYGFMVTFPGNSPRFIVSNVGDRRHINTEKNNYITAIIHHSAGHRASLRFFIVFSRDSDTAQPVLPCRNHQNENHPNHMLEVSAGNGEARWDYIYHPSVVVTPAPASREEYNVQLRFLCRNSCLTRKDLMLICQLERDGVVEGRECLDVKVSACPRRDVPKPSGNPSPPKMLREDRTQGSHQEGCSGLDESMVTVPTFALAASANSLEAFGRAQEFGVLSARLSFIDQRFKELHPEEYEKAKEDFNTLWASRIQKH
ncbi:tumor protein 63-like isoform X2 [Penaeus monodon]|uniref:tumor protein 63-like isoform X2 n=1 Tax=Penaeus monodon TaxID=6687 RepID=UPI0018A76AF5|nr:tumor protein 63-like isoform X2 [Penaeus monodon]